MPYTICLMRRIPIEVYGRYEILNGFFSDSIEDRKVKIQSMYRRDASFSICPWAFGRFELIIVLLVLISINHADAQSIPVLSIQDGLKVEKESAKSIAWKISISYGGGTPSDRGHIGLCSATIDSTGRVRVNSRNRSPADSNPRSLVVFKTDSLEPEKLERLRAAAEAVVNEPPYKPHGECSDCNYIRFSYGGKSIRIEPLFTYNRAPKEMREFIAIYNELLPAAERIRMD